MIMLYFFSDDPTGWWVSEKLDGVRAYWNGRAFYSRLGNVFVAPNWFIKVSIFTYSKYYPAYQNQLNNYKCGLDCL